MPSLLHDSAGRSADHAQPLQRYRAVPDSPDGARRASQGADRRVLWSCLFQYEPRFVEDLTAAGTPLISVASRSVFFSVFGSAEFADIQIREYINVDSKDAVSPQMYVLSL